MRKIEIAIGLLPAFLTLATGVMLFASSQEWPTDVRPETLDAATAVANADAVVLGIPIGRRDLREWIRPPSAGPGSPRLAEVETTLSVLRVLKGAPLPSEIHFIFYDSRGANLVIGMPKGPSGPIGSAGIFFLNRDANGRFRSVVDVYRPDLAVSSILQPVEAVPCASPPDCIVELLLRYREGEDQGAFASRLIADAAVSERLASYTTLAVLTDSAESDRVPQQIRRQVCSVLASSYALELPAKCLSNLESVTRHDVEVRGNQLREQLRTRGLPWVHERIGTTDEVKTEIYLRRLTQSGDPETRSVAAYWLARAR